MIRNARWIGLVLLFGLLPGRAAADPPTCLDDLKRLNVGQLEQLYAGGEAALPVGFVRGAVLHLGDTALPRFKMRLVGLVWKGKHFDERAGFINQWLCFRAVKSQACLGSSYYDGKLSVILAYPEGTPYFGNMRDEVRLIGPGLYLAMVFESTAPHKFRGFIGLEAEAARGR